MGDNEAEIVRIDDFKNGTGGYLTGLAEGFVALAIDGDDQGSSFVRRLERSDVAAEAIAPAELAGAVLAADLVLIEASAASTTELLAARSSRATPGRNCTVPRATRSM